MESNSKKGTCQNCQSQENLMGLYEVKGKEGFYCKICKIDIEQPIKHKLYQVSVILNEGLLRKLHNEDIEIFIRKEFEIALKEFFEKKYPEQVKEFFKTRYA